MSVLMKFENQEFWIKVYNVSLPCMSKTTAIQIDSEIAQVMGVDLESSRFCLGHY